MAVTNKNLPLLHRKEWQMMTLAPGGSGAGTLVIADDNGNADDALYVATGSAHWIYSHKEDGFTQIPSGALAGAYGAGACGVRHPWSINYTANGGSTTTVTIPAATYLMTGLAVGSTIEFLSAGIATGFKTTILSYLNGQGSGLGNITLTLATAAPTAILSAHTFRLSTGRYYVWSAGTTAAGSFKVFDTATQTWQASLSIVSAPATWGTDGEMVLAYNYGETYAAGTATSGTTTTITNTAKTWGVNQWANAQVRITGGTGLGQKANITSNTANVLTLPAMTVSPDATSTYVIEGSEDYLYLIGNASVTTYRFQISTNTWTTLAPTTARSGAAASGVTGDFVGATGDAQWASESAILDGRFIYSLRGGGSNAIDRFDIALNAWGVTGYLSEFPNTGSMTFFLGKWLFIKLNNSHRFFKWSVTDNVLMPLSTNFYADGTATTGHRLWVKNYDATKSIQWLYSVQSSGTTMHRIMLF